MKPAWDSLADKYAKSDKVVVADVDCPAAGEPLCSRFNVEGFPTIKFFNPPDEDGEDYSGGRDLEELTAFAETLGPGCSLDAKENCSAEQLAELEEVVKMPSEELDAELAAIKKSLKEQEAAHEKLLESLQAQYEESNKNLEEAKKASAPRAKLLKMAGAKAPAAEPEEEAPKEEL